MILIIDIGIPGTQTEAGNLVLFNDERVVLDGIFHVVARFDVIDRDEDGDVSVIRDVDQPSTDLRSHA